MTTHREIEIGEGMTSTQLTCLTHQITVIITGPSSTYLYLPVQIQVSTQCKLPTRYIIKPETSCLRESNTRHICQNLEFNKLDFVNVIDQYEKDCGEVVTFLK